jgi:hypothetical protein
MNEFCEKLLTRWTTINTKMDTFISNNFVDEDFQDFKDSVIEAFKVFKIEQNKPDIKFIDEPDNLTKDQGSLNKEPELRKKKINNKFYYVDENNNVYDFKNKNKKIGKLVNKELIYE